MVTIGTVLKLILKTPELDDWTTLIWSENMGIYDPKRPETFPLSLDWARAALERSHQLAKRHHRP